jgi:hypothetical protein
VADDLGEHPIRGEAQLTADDFKAVWVAVPQVRRMIAWFVVLVVLVPTFLWLRAGGREPLILGAIPICLLAVVYGVYRGRARWAEGALSGSQGKPVEYLFDAEAFQVKAPGRDSRAEWATLRGHLEVGSAFLIYMSPQIFVLVPKRAFTDADQARLHTELRARVPLHRAPGGSAKKLLLLWLALILVFLGIWQLLSAK